MIKKLSDEARKIWLHYFNNYLRKRHIISEEEWHKMRRMIDHT